MKLPKPENVKAGLEDLYDHAKRVSRDYALAYELALSPRTYQHEDERGPSSGVSDPTGESAIPGTQQEAIRSGLIEGVKELRRGVRAISRGSDSIYAALRKADGRHYISPGSYRKEIGEAEEKALQAAQKRRRHRGEVA